ncbi:MAG: aminoacyl-tRNA hydrolase [Candidatus Ratteibacteria bacterium]|nr:aminoacyl-tRNA hydrolase [Candidatus Ratteibacteria bacterium]
MHLIIGLGNPGREYKYTRHNAGFMAADALAKKLSIQFKKKQDYFWAKTNMGDKAVIIVKPRTFVNLSGKAVKKIAGDSGIKPDKILVIHDDADLPLGALKIKKTGSCAGHNGVASIINELCTKDFSRIRIGIGRDNKDLKNYVLSEFSASEKEVIDKIIDLSLDAISVIIKKGIDEAMQIFNRQIKE